MFHAALDAVIVMDIDGVVRDWNPAAQATFGYTHEEAVGEPLEMLIIPGALRASHRNALRRYAATGEGRMLDRRLEFPALRSDGTEIRIELTIGRIPQSEPPLFAGFVRPVGETATRQVESIRFAQRMAFLAQAGLVLDRSLDYEATLRALAELTVPELAELTVIDLLESDAVLGSAVAAAVDPDYARDLEALRASYPLDLGGSHPVARVLRSGEPLLLPAMKSDFLEEIAQSPEHLELMQRLQYHAAIVVPLVARRRVLGTLSLLRLTEAHSFDHDDLLLAQELARHAALAVDNARLFASTSNLARTLQDSLLPHALPEIPGVRLTARYRAALVGQEVGGDFYDAFRIGENRWGLAIGDVCGKGPEAAALTALGRYTIRALADRDAGTVLRRLNDAVIRDQDVLHTRFLTVVFAIVSVEDQELRLELAAAGHPPPLVLRADGTVCAVQVSGTLLGFDPHSRYLSADVSLSPGDALVLYTDGLTDARAPDRILSEADIGRLLLEARGLPAEQLADQLEGSAVGDEDPRDDIAIMVIEFAGTAVPLAEAAAVGTDADR